MTLSFPMKGNKKVFFTLRWQKGFFSIKVDLSKKLMISWGGTLYGMFSKRLGCRIIWLMLLCLGWLVFSLMWNKMGLELIFLKLPMASSREILFSLIDLFVDLGNPHGLWRLDNLNWLPSLVIDKIRVILLPSPDEDMDKCLWPGDAQASGFLFKGVSLISVGDVD